MMLPWGVAAGVASIEVALAITFASLLHVNLLSSIPIVIILGINLAVAVFAGNTFELDDRRMYERHLTAIAHLNERQVAEATVLKMTRFLDASQQCICELRVSPAPEPATLAATGATPQAPNLDVTFAYASGAAHTVCGCPPDALIGKSLYQLVHGDDVAVVRSAVNSAATSPGTPLVARFRRVGLSAGDDAWLELVGHVETAPISSLTGHAGAGAEVTTPAAFASHVVAIIGSLRDITTEHEAVARASVEHEGRLVAVAAMAAGEKALAYAAHGEVTARFVARWTVHVAARVMLLLHGTWLSLAELRNPLYGITAGLELLEPAIAVLDMQARRDFAGVGEKLLLARCRAQEHSTLTPCFMHCHNAVSAASAMRTLVDDVLDLSKVSRSACTCLRAPMIKRLVINGPDPIRNDLCSCAMAYGASNSATWICARS